MQQNAEARKALRVDKGIINKKAFRKAKWNAAWAAYSFLPISTNLWVKSRLSFFPQKQSAAAVSWINSIRGIQLATKFAEFAKLLRFYIFRCSLLSEVIISLHHFPSPRAHHTANNSQHLQMWVSSTEVRILLDCNISRAILLENYWMVGNNLVQLQPCSSLHKIRYLWEVNITFKVEGQSWRELSE